MNFTSQMRYNPETGEYEKYYRLKESYRNASGRACTRILLNVGFIHGLRPEEIRDISCGLTYKCAHGVCPPVHFKGGNHATKKTRVGLAFYELAREMGKLVRGPKKKK